MSISVDVERRRFLKASAAAGGGLLLGFFLPGGNGLRASLSGDNTDYAFNAFLRIAPDDTVTVIVNKSEMGQGVYTALPMLIAEELEADWSKIRVEPAAAHPDYYHTQWGPYQGTGGSSSVTSTWEQLRLAGAAARDMLVRAAARTWEVRVGACRAENGQVVHEASGKRLSYGALAEKASLMPVPAVVRLKEPGEFRIIGKPLKRLDTPQKIDGSARFGMDIQVPGMLTALIARPPAFGAKLGSLDDAAAKRIPGVQAVVPLEAGVAVVADGFWAAKKGRDALRVSWDEGGSAELSSPALRRKAEILADQPGRLVTSAGDPVAALAEAVTTVSAVYELPYLAHAPMEPLNCVADVRDDGCTLWTGTQLQTVDQQAAARITGFPPEKVQIHTTLLGGGFGRRANPHSDFVSEAVALSKEIKQPVKVIWTREDEMAGGYYRPMHYSRLTGGLDGNGRPAAWVHRLVGESIVKGTPFDGLIQNGIDRTSVEGAADIPYAVPNIAVDYHPVENGVPVLWWRSVGHSYTAFVVESFIDELAAAAKRDPLEFRLSLLEAHPRHRAVLECAADNAGWGAPAPEGTGRGMAVHASFGSIVAQVAEVSLDAGGRPRVKRVVCAVDCGFAVNPDIIRAQMESAVVYGLTAALYGEITLEKGRAVQSNFHNYPLLRIDEMPEVEVHILQSGAEMGGIGEPGTPPIAPAVCNGLFALTGRRVRRLPIALHDFRSI